VKVFVTGAGGYIGSALVRKLSLEGHEVTGTIRGTLDLLAPGDLSRFGPQEVVYLCAAVTRFIECESDPTSYRVNVDAQVEIAREWPAKVVFVSSQAVERALHTAYGMQKALAEVSLRGVCDPVIGRICGKVSHDTLPVVVDWLYGLADAKPGVYRCEI